MRTRLFPWLLMLLFCSLIANWLLWRAGGEPVFSSKSVENPAVKHFSVDDFSGSGAARHQTDIDPVATIEELQLLFDSGEFTTALEGLVLLSDTQSQALKNSWMQTYTVWLIEDPDAISVDDFMEAGLSLYPQDIDLRQLNAERYVSRGEMLLAIDQLYELVNENDPQLQGVFVSRIQQLFQSHVKYLAEQEAWQPLVLFSERLLWHESQHPPYIFVHARALARLEQYSMATAELSTLVNDEFYGGQAKRLLQEIARAQLQEKAIPLSQHGSHYIVGGVINNRYPVRLMIDTGATATVLSKAVFSDMNMQPEPQFLRNAEINTAGGKVRAPVYRVALFQIDDFQVRDIEFVVMDIESGGSSMGLLGMNFLSQFKFQIDQQRKVLLLSSPTS